MASVNELLALAQFEAQKSPAFALSQGIQEGLAIKRARQQEDRIFDRQTALEAAKQGIVINSEQGKSSRLSQNKTNNPFQIIASGVRQKQQQEQDKISREMDKETLDRTLALGKEFRSSPTFKTIQKVQKSARDITSAYNASLTAKDKIAADQVLVVAFNKLIDPDSVVRESEFARTPKGQALIRAIDGRLRQATEGGVGLTEASRAEIKAMGDELLAGAQQQFAQDVESFGRIVDLVNPNGGRDIVFGGFDDSVEQSSNIKIMTDAQGNRAEVEVDQSGKPIRVIREL